MGERRGWLARVYLVLPLLPTPWWVTVSLGSEKCALQSLRRHR